jgi:hypothetical protein
LGLTLWAVPASAEGQALPTLREVARAHAHGDGAVAQCLFSPDSSRMLTIGSEGDLLWWDLQKRALLRRIEPLGKRVSSVALHPREAWAVIVVPVSERPGVWRVDFDSGAAHRLWNDLPRGVQFNDDGTRLTVGSEERHGTFLTSSLVPGVAPREAPTLGLVVTRHEGAEVGTSVRSQNGEHEVMFGKDVLRRVRPRNQLYRHSYGKRCWIANDGTLALCDPGGWFRLQGHAFGDRPALTGHRGQPKALVFSADGRHLAIVSLTVVLFVDLAGRVVAEMPGPCIVQAGPEGTDFWILEPEQLRCWNAATQKDVAEPATWWGKLTLHEWFDKRCTHAIVDGQPWSARSRRLPDGSFRNLPWQRPGGNPNAHLSPLVPSDIVVAFDPGQGREGPLLLTGMPWILPKGSAHATLRRLDREGNTTSHHLFHSCPDWCVRSGDGSRVLVGFGDSICRLRAGDLTEIDVTPQVPGLRHAVVLDGRRVLATDGVELSLLLDGDKLAYGGKPALPADLDAVDLMAISADRRLLAIARRSEVRIFHVD